MRLYRKYGAGPLVQRTARPNLTDILSAFLVEWDAFNAADDYPGEIEVGLPAGPEDP